MQREIKYRFYKGNNFIVNSFNLGDPKIVDLMQDGWLALQFTGWKDKNNIEICEGDFCKEIPNSTRRSPEIILVEWGVLENCGDCFNDSGVGFNFYMHQPEKLEIVGNKFINKIEDFKS